MTLSKTLLRNSTLAAGAAALLAGAPALADNHKEHREEAYKFENVHEAKATLDNCRTVAETCGADIDAAGLSDGPAAQILMRQLASSSFRKSGKLT